MSTSFYVKGIPFLHTKSKDLNYVTIQKLGRQTSAEIMKKLKNIVTKNFTRDITIADIFGNN